MIFTKIFLNNTHNVIWEKNPEHKIAYTVESPPSKECIGTRSAGGPPRYSKVLLSVIL